MRYFTIIWILIVLDAKVDFNFYSKKVPERYVSEHVEAVLTPSVILLLPVLISQKELLMISEPIILAVQQKPNPTQPLVWIHKSLHPQPSTGYAPLSLTEWV